MQRFETINASFCLHQHNQIEAAFARSIVYDYLQNNTVSLRAADGVVQSSPDVSEYVPTERLHLAACEEETSECLNMS